jgi:hypothetical protein
MTQIGESVSVIPPGGKEKCVFCKKDHQHSEKAAKADFPRDMSKLKKEGRVYSISNYSSHYPGVNMPPLVEWAKKDVTKTGGYKAAAHHCIALKSVSQHEISGELKEAGYDPNRGSNCSWLPYSKPQFSRARAYNKALQKHRGGHTNSYFEKVVEHLDKVSKLTADEFCNEDETTSKEDLLYFMELQEKAIWRGLSNSFMNAYHLYNVSYLDPKAAWGSFEYENGKSKADVKGAPPPSIDDEQAESESSEDPE